MANAPVVIPGGVTLLANAVALDATLTTAQTVFTVGNGETAYPAFVVFRGASSAINAATTVSVGTTASATAYYNGSAALQSMLTTTGPIWLPVYGSSVATAVAAIPGGSVMSVTFGGTLTSNKKVSIDVYGYQSVF